MASPQRRLPPEPDPEPVIEMHGRGRGPRRFRWWWLWIAFIVAAIVWYVTFGSSRGGWYQRHFSNPSSTRPLGHPQPTSTAPSASRRGNDQQGFGAMSGREASETGNGQGQSTGRTAPQASPHNNATANHSH